MNDRINAHKNRIAELFGETKAKLQPAASPAEPNIPEEREQRVSPESEDEAANHPGYEEPSSDHVEKLFQETVGDFRALLRKPLPGSLLYFVNDSKNSIKQIEKKLFSDYVGDWFLLLSDPAVEMASYTMYSLVLPRKDALTVAEDFAAHTKDMTESQSYEALSKITGFNMKDRGDVVAAVRAVLRRSERVGSLIRSHVKIFGR